MANDDVLHIFAQFELVITHEFNANNLANADGDRVLMQHHFEQEIQMAFAEWDIDIQLDKDIKHTSAQHHSFLGRLQREFDIQADDIKAGESPSDDLITNDLMLKQMKSDVEQCCDMIPYETTLVSFRVL
ncbi:hypothetical protein [Shewanella saliphila]|uniref:Uncharacterized protein n=1 Tax=Shewanella saliphila TaxID=2282698 RepID=A0ABQ2Q263_9GAMM|nr:hypothetical protein [Shewanella saliphila]MCL1100360.1 hypothetical protein [Shewanella saliphila]GGP37579.1 hypothetical protein GCM10009409_00520 [Shewanella saliphila]